MSKTTNVNFAESTTQNRSQVITIPNLKSVVSVTVNTGNVSYSVNGNDITINVSNGAYTRYTTSSYTPSTTASQTVTTSSSSPPGAPYYNDGTYSGTLSTYNGYTTSVASGSPADSKTVSHNEPITQSLCGDVYPTANPPSTYNYNDGTYSGTLSYTGKSSNSYSTGGSCGTDGYTWHYTSYTAYYSGTVSKPDTRTYNYHHSYSGTVYGATQTTYTYYYAYTVTVEYIDNTAPTLVTKIGAQTLTNNQNILVSDKNGTTFTITPSDVDVSDTLQYSIDLRGVNKVAYTNATKDVGINYTVPYSDLVLGNNLVTIKIKDSAGDITTFNVTLRNKTPSSLSQKTVGDVLSAMGYSYTNISSLQALKPSGYSGNLSMSDIINYLT